MNEDDEGRARALWRVPPLRKAWVRTAVLAWLAGCVLAAGLASANDLAGPEFGGSGHGASISQYGQLNMASIDQREPGQFARLAQDGLGNRLEAWQSGGQGNMVHASQAGTNNAAMITQSGSWHELTLDQRGDANIANVAQHGAGRVALIEQFGNSNRVDLVQGPSSPAIALRQYGDNNVATLIQY
ncbi:hypothetical protein [Massilia niabensis]|uniref:Curlin n=1 Tax=Massilia niabensis TaxID=544910 RepID=A0ABW0L2L1_9BURK